jgi:hypothetical protein
MWAVGDVEWWGLIVVCQALQAMQRPEAAVRLEPGVVPMLVLGTCAREGAVITPAEASVSCSVSSLGLGRQIVETLCVSKFSGAGGVWACGDFQVKPWV